MAKVFDLLLHPVALGKFGVKLVFAKDVQDQTKVMQVLFLGFGVNQNVVQVAHDKLIDVRPEHTVHASLESGRGVNQAKAQHGVLKVTKGRAKGRGRDVGVSNADLVVALLQINGAKVSGPTQFIK